MTSAEMWTEHERDFLRAVGDLLIPAGADMPAASTVDVAGDGIDHIGRIRDDLVHVAKRVANKSSSRLPTSIAEVKETAGEGFSGVCELIASAYFLRPDVARLLRYRKRVAIPMDDEVQRSAEFELLTQPVVLRGNVWRATP